MLATLQTLILVFMRNGLLVQSIFSYLTFSCVLFVSGLPEFSALELGKQNLSFYSLSALQQLSTF